MIQRLGRISMMALPLVALVFAGCPSGGGGGVSGLIIAPAAVNFGGQATKKSVSIYSSSGSLIAYSVQESIPWLVADSAGGTVSTETDHVEFTIDRTGLAPGNYNGTVTIGGKNLLVAMTVPGTPTIAVDPPTINFLNNLETSQFTITNNGTGSLTWNLSLFDQDSPNDEIAVPDFMTIDPLGGTTQVGNVSVVTIEIDREQIDPGVLGYIIKITSNAGDAQVAVNITEGLAASIGVEPGALDFGTTSNVLTFDVFNNGFPGSTLNFTLATDRPDLIFFAPDEGTSIGTNNILNYDRVPITVTIDRNAVDGQIDGGKITVSAPGVESVDVVVNVEASPLVFEGAENRSRPPFILRFVFLLRDALGEAIDTTDPLVMDELQTAFSVEEDGVALDVDETNLFVTSAEGLRYNLVLLLDFTGSMFNAPPGNGAAIEQMVQASQDFITDLPESYRLSLMEYHERQQTNRLIHNFSTSKDSLIDGLLAFTVPTGEHGASEVHDAVIDACTRLANEDLGVLSFDDADVRAVIFISDGRDTSSVNNVDEVIDFATDNRVRLYPIGFGQTVNASALIQMATETGGHYYPAPTVADLVNLLQNELELGAAAPGVIVKELQRQVVLTYLSLFQEGSHNYLISANYQGLEGSFQRDAVFATGGDVRAGQIGMRTAGIQPDGTARVFVRTEYVPRNVTQFRVRFISAVPITVELDPNGLISPANGWVLVDEGGNVFTALTTDDNPLQYGAFGNLFRVNYAGLAINDVVPLGFRVDNRIYVNPPFTKFFQYPELIVVAEGSSQSSIIPIQIADGFDPDALNAWDRDEDTFADFDDLFPDDPDLN